MNIMLDLETMGNGPDSAIIAIGACKFDPIGIQDTFYTIVNLTSSLNAGLQVGGDTILWWLKQSDDARKAIYSPENEKELETALRNFSHWITETSLDDPKIWGNGASFDNVILANSYKQTGLMKPWKYYNDRCYRTVKNMYPEIKMQRKGTHHNALDDAISQAEHLIEIWKVTE